MARWSSAKRSRSLSRVSSSSKNKSKLPPRVPEPDADRHGRRGGRGEEWSGDACVALASPMGGRWEAAGEQDVGRPKGPHPSSLPPPPLRDKAASLFVSQNS